MRLSCALLRLERYLGLELGLECSCLALQSLDLAEYNFLFALSFTTPTFDSEVAPSFGTLLATVNVVLNMLGEVNWVRSGPLHPNLHPNSPLPNRDLGHNGLAFRACSSFIKPRW